MIIINISITIIVVITLYTARFLYLSPKHRGYHWMSPKDSGFLCNKPALLVVAIKEHCIIRSIRPSTHHILYL
jgi:hypothetical protein